MPRREDDNKIPVMASLFVKMDEKMELLDMSLKNGRNVYFK